MSTLKIKKKKVWLWRSETEEFRDVEWEGRRCEERKLVARN